MKKKAEFSILYHTRVWLQSDSITYICVFPLSALLENVLKVMKVSDANGKLVFGRPYCEISRDWLNSTNKILSEQ